MPSVKTRLLLLACVLPALLAVSALLLARRAPPAPAAPAASASAPASTPLVTRTEREGLAVELELRPTPAAGEPGDAVATLTLTDARSGEPVRGVRPRAWMALREEGQAPSDEECRARIKTYLGGLLSVQPEVDLNAWFLLTMNHDNTLSVINPQLAFSRTKLRSLVTLAGPAADWALHPDRNALFVSIPSAGKVSVVDTRTFLAAASIPVGKAPQRLALAPDGRTLWVGNDGEDTVSVVDTQTRTVLATLEVGGGHHELAFADGGRTAWVASAGAEAVRVFDTVTLEEVGRVEAGEGVVALAASELARAVYVANGRTGEVVVASVHGAREQRRLKLEPGLSALRIDPSGRWAFAVHPERNRVTVLDTAGGSQEQVLTGFSSPDTVSFSTGFAYVRNAASATVSLVRLDSLGKEGAPAVVDVQVGQRAAREARRTSLASPFAPTPEGTGMVVASPADQGLAYYVEGMMAPMGTLKNYGREPRAALILDRSLAEVQPGVYRTAVQLGAPGTYDVAFLLDSPRIATCMPLEVDAVTAGRPTSTPHRLELTPELDAQARLAPDAEHLLRFRLRDKAGGAPLEASEVSVLLFRPPGGWQWRGPPRALGEGRFEVPFRPPTPGTYTLLVSAPSRSAPAGALRPVTLRVGPSRAHVSSPTVNAKVSP